MSKDETGTTESQGIPGYSANSPIPGGFPLPTPTATAAPAPCAENPCAGSILMIRLPIVRMIRQPPT